MIWLENVSFGRCHFDKKCSCISNWTSSCISLLGDNFQNDLVFFCYRSQNHLSISIYWRRKRTKKIKENQARMHEDKQLVCLRAIYYDCVGASSHTHLIKIHFQFNWMVVFIYLPFLKSSFSTIFIRMWSIFGCNIILCALPQWKPNKKNT